MSKRMRKPEHFKTITSECASHIFEYHKEYPKLGHDGLLKVLREHEFKVNPDELSTFLDEHKIHGERWQLAWGHIPGRFRIRFFTGVYIGGKD